MLLQFYRAHLELSDVDPEKTRKNISIINSIIIGCSVASLKIGHKKKEFSILAKRKILDVVISRLNLDPQATQSAMKYSPYV